MRICDTCIIEDCKNCDYFTTNYEEEIKMTTNIICDFKFKSGAKMPHYMTEDSSGMDISSTLDIVIPAGHWAAVPTGLIPCSVENCEIQVRPRSGLAIRHGVTVLNSPGTIDADYRGEIKVLLINHGKEDFQILQGDRIAQLVFTPILKASIVEVDRETQTQRSTGGFGSTGR